MRFAGPWRGDARGFLVDWATQRWVRLSGRRVDLVREPWLRGPSGGTRAIGPDFFQTLAAEPVRAFYEHTADHALDVWSEWSPGFRPFGALVAALFSRRLEQLNVPLGSLATRLGMTSTIVELVDRGGGEPLLTSWVRCNPATQRTVYVGSYSLVQVPGWPAPCVKVVFPLPNGSATVILRPVAGPGGALVLESSGQRFGAPGFYFVVRGAGERAWARHLRSFRERIEVYAGPDGALRTDHVFSLWHRPVLRLHYRMSRIGRMAAEHGRA